MVMLARGTKCGIEHEASMPVESRKAMKRLTPPELSFITSTNPLLRPPTSEHLWYKVPRLTPSCSMLYTRSQSVANCNRGGNRSRISSASMRVRICAEAEVEERTPVRERAVRGGGANGEPARLSGLKTPSKSV